MISSKERLQIASTVLRPLLRARGGRLTPQRLAIYEAVVGQTTHPSVEMVHAAVRARFPGISQATVYTTLDLFARLGLIQEVGGRVRRYDGRAGRHVNLVCERCGEVTDVADSRLDALERRTAARAEFDVRSARFELHGVCPRCLGRARRGAGARGAHERRVQMGGAHRAVDPGRGGAEGALKRRGQTGGADRAVDPGRGGAAGAPQRRGQTGGADRAVDPGRSGAAGAPQRRGRTGGKA